VRAICLPQNVIAFRKILVTIPKIGLLLFPQCNLTICDRLAEPLMNTEACYSVMFVQVDADIVCLQEIEVTGCVPMQAEMC
jgi:hypothetical protein